MATQTFNCPHCGLQMTVERVNGGTRIGYDAAEWRRLCKHPELESPAMCLLLRNGGGSPAAPTGSPGTPAD